MPFGSRRTIHLVSSHAYAQHHGVRSLIVVSNKFERAPIAKVTIFIRIFEALFLIKGKTKLELIYLAFAYLRHVHDRDRRFRPAH